MVGNDKRARNGRATTAAAAVLWESAFELPIDWVGHREPSGERVR